ncbi:MAG: two-component sensor histidine kinase, partial [Actinomyces sp.]|nr:two-component sensor histidine kinase [Actinomyces sp.]
MVLILVAGTIVATQLRSSVFESRRTAVLSDAALRFSTAQSVFDQSTASTPDQIQESTRQLATSLRVSASGTGAVSVLLLRSESQSQSLRINEIVDPTVLGVISEEMKNAVARSTDPQWQSVSIPSARDANQRVPAILVGTNVQVPRAGTHQLYIVYSLQADQERIDTVMGILIFA